ncbi:hypothetical protein QJU96_10060 [Pasteurella skyensis]|uniref:hypothetical protein n=1 Tax=Phocoenobacter skyensis TaxID=97481 RepID=UPI002791618D|nr:hypothetical protein [Pasteurella skyensis]MDP8171626.1 hypothetical protein [Pasteurella skyensis]
MSIYHKINQSIPTYEDYDILCNDYFLWQKSAKTDSEASHKRYLSKYPNGYFSEQAQSRYRTLENQRIERERRQAEERKRLEEKKRKKEAQRKEQQRLKAEAKRKEDVAWNKAFDSLTIEALNQYKEQYPNGRYVVQANAVIHDIKAWEFAKLKNTLIAYDEYLANFSDGLFVDKAEYGKELCIKQEDSTWQKAFDSLTIEALNQYKDQYQNGRYIKDANKTIEDINAWNMAKEMNNIDSYTSYLNNFSKGCFVSNAKHNAFELVKIKIERNQIIDQFLETVS